MLEYPSWKSLSVHRLDLLHFLAEVANIDLAPLVQGVDSAIHCIIHGKRFW